MMTILQLRAVENIRKGNDGYDDGGGDEYNDDDDNGG